MSELYDIQKVSDLLSFWLSQIRSRNAIDFFDINRVAENIAATLLNLVYNLDLKNLNEEIRNFPGIDLGDEKNKIAFQVTSRTDSRKIEESLKKFVEGPISRFPQGIRFFIVNNEKPHLSSGKLTSICPGFDPDIDILTDKDLMVEIKKIYRQDRERFYRILDFLKTEFGSENDSISLKKEPSKALLEGSRRYYNALHGDNGRFRYLGISESILSHPENEWSENPLISELCEDAENKFEYKKSVQKENKLNILNVISSLWNKKCKHAIITGDSGMGKTVSLIHCWKNYLKNQDEIKPVPVFIPLNEFNQVKKYNRDDFILFMILRYYESSLTKEQIWEAMKKPLPQGECTPWMVLLLDGFNEITVENSELLLELACISEQCPGVQILITNRYDLRDNFNWDDWNLLKLKGLDDMQVRLFLEEKKMEIPQKGKLKELIRNPMILSLYAKESKAHQLPINIDSSYKITGLWAISEHYFEERIYSKALSFASEAFEQGNQNDSLNIYKLGIYTAFTGNNLKASDMIKCALELDETSISGILINSKKEDIESDILEFFKYIVSDEEVKAQNEKVAINEFELLLTSLEGVRNFQNDNIILKIRKCIQTLYQKLADTSYYFSFFCIKNWLLLNDIKKDITDLTSYYSEYDSKEKKYLSLKRANESSKNYGCLLYLLLFIIPYLATVFLFLNKYKDKYSGNFLSWLLITLIMFVIEFLNILIRVILGYSSVKELFEMHFIMAFICIFIFIIVFLKILFKKEELEREIKVEESKWNYYKNRIKEIEINIKQKLDKIK
jgi:hypothetical protein